MKTLWAVIMTAFTGYAQAQLNESDTINWQLKAAVTGNVLGGNVARTFILNRIEVMNANPQWGFSTRTDYQYGRTYRKLTESDVVSYNFIYRQPLARVYPYAMLLIETNLRRQIDIRYQAGPGISINLIQKIGSTLKVSCTATYEVTQFNGDSFDEKIYDGSSSIETWRMTGRVFGRHVIATKAKFGYELWMQQSLQEMVNYRYHVEGFAEIPFSHRIAFRTTARYSYENIELTGLKPFDFLWTFGFSYTRIKT